MILPSARQVMPYVAAAAAALLDPRRLSNRLYLSASADECRRLDGCGGGKKKPSEPPL